MPIETIEELIDRMKSEKIDRFEPVNGESIVMIQPPKRILNMEKREIFFYVLVCHINDDGSKGCVRYDIITEEDCFNMMDQAKAIFNSCDENGMYV